MTNDPVDLYPVTEKHALYFGQIISAFARIENHMTIVAAGILNTDLGTAYILLGEMTYRQKRQTIKHLNSTIGVNGIVNQEINDALDRAHKHSKLRNLIAHYVWTNGRKPNAIKPLFLKLRGETLKALGMEDNEKNYSLDDLREAAKETHEAMYDLYQALEDGGLIERIEENMSEINPSTA